MANWFHFTLTVVVLLSCVYERIADENHWDFFMFTQEWPVSMCIYEKLQHHKCFVPSNITTWTIHGLWPSKFHGEGPAACNKTWKFDSKQIASILGSLEKYWPNLFPDSEKYDFWSHEWEKHGTCSTNLPATSDELLYFKTALKLQNKFDLFNTLKSKGVIPRNDDGYSFHQIRDIITNWLGVKTEISCFIHQKKYYLRQIQICINKQFRLIDCGTSQKLSDLFFEECPRNSSDYIYYPFNSPSL